MSATMRHAFYNFILPVRYPRSYRTAVWRWIDMGGRLGLRNGAEVALEEGADRILGLMGKERGKQTTQ